MHREHVLLQVEEMGPQARIKTKDLGALLRLIHELHEMQPNPVIRHEHLLRRLCAIVGADVGGSAVFDRSGVEPALQFVVYTDANGSAQEHKLDFPHRFDPPDAMIQRLLKRVGAGSGKALVCSDAQLSPRQSARRSRRPAKRPASVFSALSLEPATAAVVYLARHRSKRSRFSREQCEIVALLHAGVAWIYEPERPGGSGQLAALSPRQRETLDCLLAGHSEKQIAKELGRSPHTVHIYVKAIYRAFGVSSRAELLSRFVRWRHNEP